MVHKSCQYHTIKSRKHIGQPEQEYKTLHPELYPTAFTIAAVHSFNQLQQLFSHQHSLIDNAERNSL